MERRGIIGEALDFQSTDYSSINIHFPTPFLRRKRDPRFDRNVEQGDQVHARARKNYSFVFDDLIPEEERKIKASLKVILLFLLLVPKHSDEMEICYPD